MKNRKIILAFIFLLSALVSQAQIRIPQALKQAANSLIPGGPNELEIRSALKEALKLGVSAGTSRLSAPDGFQSNRAVKLLFPSDSRKIEKALRGIGLNKQCDDFILSLNRAAELAATEAAPIFLSAITEIRLDDASEILLSQEADAATNYFKRMTSNELGSKFQPIIQNALNKTEATRYWSELISKYNQLPGAGKINTDLSSYATQKAINGLYYEIAQEEIKMRRNPELRDTPLLKKVFNYADNNQGLTFR